MDCLDFGPYSPRASSQSRVEQESSDVLLLPPSLASISSFLLDRVFVCFISDMILLKFFSHNYFQSVRKGSSGKFKKIFHITQFLSEFGQINQFKFRSKISQITHDDNLFQLLNFNVLTPPHNIVLCLKLMTKLLTSKSLTCETLNSERAVTGYFTLKKLLLSLSNILSNTFLIC